MAERNAGSEASEDRALEHLHWIAGSAAFRDVVLRLDDELLSDLSNLADLARPLPPAVWAALLAEPERHLLRSQAFLPALPDGATQMRSVGSSGGAMLVDALAYVRVLRMAMGSAPREGHVVEFGAGWGRLTRLLLQDVPIDDYLGLEPFKHGVEAARESGLGRVITRTRLRLAPEDLPKKARMAFASQLFMVLSPDAFVDNLTLLVDALAPGGGCVVSVRLPEYWLLEPHADPEKVIETDEHGICHVPGRWPDLGETVVSRRWMSDQLTKAGLTHLRVDWIPEQAHAVHWSGYRESVAVPS
jgi:hypothetical protein